MEIEIPRDAKSRLMERAFAKDAFHPADGYWPRIKSQFSLAAHFLLF